MLKFDGIGMYTNANGTYLGDSALDPVFSLLNKRSATVFVHPVAPGCAGAALGHPDPMTEYPFESVRAMENMLLTGQRANYSQINMIFPHGGGAMPYVATRIAGMASLSFLGSMNVTTTLAQFKGYLFDTASSTTLIQLMAMKEFFGGTSKIVTGTDCEFLGFLFFCDRHSRRMFTNSLPQIHMYPWLKRNLDSQQYRPMETSARRRWRRSIIKML